VPILPMLSVAMHSRPVAKGLASRLADDDPVLASTLNTILEATGEAQMSAMTPYVTSKLIRFYGPAVARRILCQRESIDFGAVIANRKILLVEVQKSRLGSEAAALLARQIIVRLAQAAMSQTPGQPVVPHFIFADEFHSFATERFAVLLSEGRKFGLGLTLAHQYTSQLVSDRGRRVLDAVLGNAGTAVLFRLGLADARLLEDLVAPRATAHDIAGLPNFIAIVRSVGLNRVPFTLRTPPPLNTTAVAGPDFRSAASRRIAQRADEVDAAIATDLTALGRVRAPDRPAGKKSETS
jgi:hypothetical protein